MPFHQTYDKYWKFSILYFLLAACFSALFALGLEYTRETKESVMKTPYFFPNMVSAVFSTLMFGSTLVITYKGNKIKQLAELNLTRPSYLYDHDRVIRKARTFYGMVQSVSMVWGIVGAALVGSSGLCIRKNENGEYLCYYDVNYTENRAIAAVSIVFHVMLLLITFVLSFSVGKQPAVAPMGIKATKPPEILLSKKNPPNLRTKDDSGAAKNINETLNTIKTLSIQRRKTEQEMDRKKREAALRLANDSSDSGQEYVTLEPIVKPKRRLARIHSNLEKRTPERSMKKRQSMKRHTSKFTLDANLSPMSTDVNVAPANTGPEVPPPAPPLAYLLDSDGRDQKFPQNDKLHISIARTMSTGGDVIIRPAPPSYDDAMKEQTLVRKQSSKLSLHRRETDQGGNPYFLPPLPGNDVTYMAAPTDMYSGTSYPDTDIVAIQPVHYQNQRPL